MKSTKQGRNAHDLMDSLLSPNANNYYDHLFEKRKNSIL
jgi:hypothetical protein